MEPGVVALIVGIAIVLIAVIILIVSRISSLKKRKKYERGLKMVPLLIHLPPMTDDIQQGARDERDITGEIVSQAQVMYSILASTTTKGMNAKMYGQRHFSFEIIAKDGFIKYYAVVPSVLTETVRQAIQAAYPTARIEERMEENIFSKEGKLDGVSGAELTLKKNGYLPIATYEETRRDASMAILNALSLVGKGEGAAVQILFRPASKKWSETTKKYVETTQKGKKTKTIGASLGDIVSDIIRAPWEVPKEHEKKTETVETITTIKQNELNSIIEKMRYPAFETLIRVIASAPNKARYSVL